MTKTVIEKQYPPAIMLVYIEEPAKPERNSEGTITNGQLETWLRSYQSAVRQCNINIQSLRQWSEIEEPK